MWIKEFQPVINPRTVKLIENDHAVETNTT